MTNRANRTVGRRELLRVTTGTWKMLRRAWTFGHGRVRIASMAEQTRKPRMIATIMLKLRVVEPFGKLHLALGRLIWRKTARRSRSIRACHHQRANHDEKKREGRRREIFIEALTIGFEAQKRNELQTRPLAAPTELICPFMSWFYKHSAPTELIQLITHYSSHITKYSFSASASESPADDSRASVLCRT